MSKKEQNIYAVSVVLVLLLLLFGDKIMLKFISEKPNSNNTVFGGTKKEVSYDNVYVSKISLEDMIANMNLGKSFFVIFTRSDCFVCDELFRKDYLFKDSSWPIYYVERNVYTENKDSVIYLENSSEDVKENIEITPYIIMVKDGFISDTLLGSSKDDKIANFFKQN